jgi:hypothetical protein
MKIYISGVFCLAFLYSRYVKATKPASVALPNAMKYGLKLRTAILLTGKVKLKIKMPTKPISIPLVSLFTLDLYLLELLYWQSYSADY